MLATKNNLKSELAQNVAVLDSTIKIKSGEGVLRENQMVACLEHYENDVCTKREIVKITAKNWDTFTVSRWFADCIMNDATKDKGHASQTFNQWDFLNLYLNKEIRESLQAEIQNNETAIETMLSNLSTPKNRVESNLDSWIWTVDSKFRTKYWWIAWFWTGADGDVVIEEDTFLDATREYNFRNLTIKAGVTVWFEWHGVPKINVRDTFRNEWTINLLWVKNLCSTTPNSYTDKRLENWTIVSNKFESSAVFTEPWRHFGGSWSQNGETATVWKGGDWWWNPWSAVWVNGGAWLDKIWSWTTDGGWWWWWAYLFGTWWKGWLGATWWNWYIGGLWWWSKYQWSWTPYQRVTGTGWRWLLRWWNWWSWYWWSDYNYLWNWWSAISNMYWLHLNARNIRNNRILAKGGDWWNAGEMIIGASSSYWAYNWNGWNWAPWWQVLISCDTILQQWTIDVRGWVGWTHWRRRFSSGSTARRDTWSNGTNGADWRLVIKSINNPYIENFTLSLDETNEKIKISWKDPDIKSSAPQQRARTEVRYSTSNYPATISQGTRAVNETTKNQYLTTPFSMSATDGLTYYFTAFAIDTNWWIIDIKTANIKAEFLRWRYQKVEYIQSSWSQYIHTSIIPTNSIWLYIKVSSQNVSNDSMYLWSNDNSSDSWSKKFWIWNASYKLYFWRNSWLPPSQNRPSTTANTIVELENNFLNSRLMKKDNNTIYNISETLTSNWFPINIFAHNWWWTAQYFTSIKLYSLKISNWSTITHEFVPCYRKSDNVIWLLEIKNKVFYTNQWSWSFTKGWDIN